MDHNATPPAEVFPHFLDDVCLRCGRVFRHHELCLVVYGGPQAKYRDVGLVVCRTCYQGEELDTVRDCTIYGAPKQFIKGQPPKYYGQAGTTGYAKLSRLEDGSFRLGLHRGHVEVWTEEMVKSPAGQLAVEHPEHMAYATGSLLYGSVEFFRAQRMPHLSCVEVRFVDLLHPEAPILPKVPRGLKMHDGVTEHITLEAWWESRSVNIYDRPLRPTDAVVYLDALLAAVRDPQVQASTIWRFCDATRRDRLWLTIEDVLRHTDIVIWQQPQWMAAIRGAEEAFHGTPCHDEEWPERPQLWLFAEPPWLPEYGGEPANHHMFELKRSCLLVGLLLVRNRSPETGRYGLTACFLFYPLNPYDWPWESPPELRHAPGMFVGNELAWPYTDIAAAMHFMGLPIVTREPMGLPRQSRRQREREDRPVPNISVVQLRRLVRPGPATTDADQEGVDWSCHWLVKGHWRRQWHPSLGEHRPIYIDAHLKGDFEKPFRPPRQKLYVVAR